VFRYSGIRVFRYSGVRVFRCPGRSSSDPEYLNA
jgi:hypothetical protein